MPNFNPDQVTFKDVPGYGAWDTGHWREHIQFVQVLAAQTPPILLADYDFSALLGNSGGDRNAVVQSHQVVHSILSQITGITAVDFSEFNLDGGDDFYSFLGYHATTHQQLRQALGIV
jgi:hypothetical protein